MYRNAWFNLLLHPNECTQRLCYYSFAVDLDKCVESCNAFNDVSNRVCVPNKTEDFNIHDFNMITRINESKSLTKNVSCKSEFKFDVSVKM